MNINIPKTPTSATGWNPIPKLQTTLNIPLVGSSTFKNNNLFKFISLSGIITFLILFYYIFVKTNTDKKYETGFTWLAIILSLLWLNYASNNLFSNLFMDVFSYSAGSTSTTIFKVIGFGLLVAGLLAGIYFGFIGKKFDKSETGFRNFYWVILGIGLALAGFYLVNNILTNNGATNFATNFGNNNSFGTSIIVPLVTLVLFLTAFYYILIGKVYDVKHEVGTMWVYGLFTTIFILLFLFDIFKTLTNAQGTSMPIFSFLKNMVFSGNLIYPIGSLIFLITFVTSIYYAFGGSPSAKSGANFNPGILFFIILLLGIAGLAYNMFKGRYSEIPENTNMYSLTAFIILLLVPLSLLFYYLFFKPKKGEYETIRRASSPVWWFIFFFAIFIGFMCYKIFGGNFTEIMSSAFITQFSGVFYLILYTIFLIVFFSIINSNIKDNPSTNIWLNDIWPKDFFGIKNLGEIIGIEKLGRVIDYIVPITILVTAFFLYIALKSNIGSIFNITFERIKMMAVLFCFVTILITYYTATPPVNADGGLEKNNFISKYYGNSLIIVLLLAIFGFLYLLVLLTVPDTSSSSSLPNFLNNFSKYSTASTIGLIIFIVAAVIGITTNNKQLVDKGVRDGVIVATFVTALIWASAILLPNKISDFFANDSKAKENMGVWNKAFLAMFGMAAVGCLIFWLSKNIKILIANSNDKNTIIKFILNLFLIFVIMILIYKTIYVELPYGNAQKNTFFDLIIDAIFYIPCILSNIYDLVMSNLFTDKFTFSNHLNSTKPGTFTLIIVLILLIAGIFVYPLFEDKVILQGGDLLLNRPINTNKETVIGKYKNLYIPSANFATDTPFKVGDKVMQNGENIECGILNDGFVGTVDSINQVNNTITLRQEANNLKDKNDNLCGDKVVYTYDKLGLKLVADSAVNMSMLYDYRYAISAWIFLDAMPPSTNKSYQKYTSILSYGGKPDILYNPSENIILITMRMKLGSNANKYDILEQSETNYDDDYFRSYTGTNSQTKDLSIVIVHRMEHVLLQKWNQFVINCDGGTIDVFCNNELIKSQIKMVPYMTSDNLTVGQDGGVYGGICNVVYFNEPLTSDKMYYSYNAAKSSNPPILNGSNTSLSFFEQKKMFS
jgi:hypothetical protein